MTPLMQYISRREGSGGWSGGGAVGEED